MTILCIEPMSLSCGTDLKKKKINILKFNTVTWSHGDIFIVLLLPDCHNS